MGDGIRWAISPIELLEGVELYGAAEYIAVEGQNVTSGASEMER